MSVIATYLRDDKANTKFRGQDVTMDEAEAAPLAARQIVSISSMKGDPNAPHRVAELIPPEVDPVMTAAFAAGTVSVVVGASANLPAVNVTKASGATGTDSTLENFQSSNTAVATLSKSGNNIVVTGVSAGSATVTYSSNGQTATKAVTVTAS